MSTVSGGPKAKRRKVLKSSNGHSNAGALANSARFKPGNIIRLRVWNFTTYSYGVFNLSPSLNMIIGPNGTGKSTFVAAVCLGLGGRIDLIKRKSLDSMIKSGEKESTIEITLKNKDDGPDIIIKRTFFLKQAKSIWKVNGTVSDMTAVRSLVQSFNIQLDNLCHFLPQERVAEFASLSPDKLLLEMERTVGDATLLETHQLLIQLDESRVQVQAEIETIEQTIADLNADVEKFELEAQKFKEYEEKSRSIDHHRKLLPYARLQDQKKRMQNLKILRDSAKKAMREFSGKLAPLTQHAEQAAADLESREIENRDLGASVQSLRLEAEKYSEKLLKISEELPLLQAKIEKLKGRTESQKRELQTMRDEKDDLERKLRKLEPVDDEMLKTLTDERRQQHEEKLRVDEEFDALKYETNTLRREIASREQRFQDERKKLESNDRLEVFTASNTRYRKELLENAYKAHLFLRQEKKNQDLTYCEAPVVSCRVKEQKYAKYFEKVIDNNSLFALFFDSEQDYKRVSSSLPKEINVPMRVASRSRLQPPMPVEYLKQLGFDGYLSDFITGPETVIQGLNHRSSLHCIPVSLGPVDQKVIKKLLEPTKDGKIRFTRFVVENSLFIVGRSRYGSKQMFYQTENIGGAQLMGAGGLSEDVKREISERLSDLKRKLSDMYNQRKDLDLRKEEYQKQITEVDEKFKSLDTQVRTLRRRQEARLALVENIRHSEERIALLERSTTEDHTANIRECEDALLLRYMRYAEVSSEITKASESLIHETISQKKGELLRQQSENKLVSIKSLLQELEDKKVALEEKYLAAKSKYEEYKKSDAAKEIREQNLNPVDREAVRELAERYVNQNQFSEAFILGIIEQLEDDLSVLSSVDKGSMELLKRKRADLEVAENQLPRLKSSLSSLTERISKNSIPWEAELSELVEKISRAFQKRFVTVASDGQVELVKLERFKNWKLEILVKFRENSELKVLDHQSQSGGERAVSTIFFIMSLQGLAIAPIRIVDEINQGMDPKNEKMAHKYLVHTACKLKSSQYFLVTPKLLTGLYYHPEMAIHCIFTGPFLKGNDRTETVKDFLNLQQRGRIRA